MWIFSSNAVFTCVSAKLNLATTIAAKINQKIIAGTNVSAKTVYFERVISVVRGSSLKKCNVAVDEEGRGENHICRGRTWKAFIWFLFYLTNLLYLFLSEHGPDSASCKPDYQRRNCYSSYREYQVLSRNASLSVTWWQTSTAKIYIRSFFTYKWGQWINLALK